MPSDKAWRESSYLSEECHAHITKLRSRPPATVEEEPRLIRLLESTFTSNVVGPRTPHRKRPMCRIALHAAVYSVLHPEKMSEETARRLAMEYPTFVNALVYWVFHCHDLQALEPVQRELSSCLCHLDGNRLKRSLHDDWPVDSPFQPNVSIPMMNDIFIFLKYLVRPMDAAKLSRIFDKKKPKPKEQGYKTLARFLTCQGGDIVAACRSHLVVYWSDSILEFLEDLATALPSVFEPAIAEHHLFLGQVAIDIEQLLKLYAEKRRLTPMLAHAIHVRSRFLSVLFSDILDYEAGNRVFSGNHTAAIVYTKVVESLKVLDDFGIDDPEQAMSSDNVSAHLAQIGVSLHPLLPFQLVGTLDPIVLKWKTRWLDSQDTQEFLPALYVWKSMHTFKSSRRCMNVTCGKLPVTSLKPFRKCAGCRLLSYCSTECQRRAWRGEQSCQWEVPHSMLCKPLKAFWTAWADFESLNIADEVSSVSYYVAHARVYSDEDADAEEWVDEDMDADSLSQIIARRPELVEKLENDKVDYVKNALLLRRLPPGYNETMLSGVTILTQVFVKSVVDKMGSLGFKG